MPLARAVTLRLLPALAAPASCALALAVAAPATATAATAPSAITGAVSAVSATTATVTGTVNPNGSATTWLFEYGTSTSYGAQTTGESAGAGSADTGVSATLSGLTPGTTYHYRLDAQSAGGSIEGSDGIFTTTAAPGAVTDPASGVTGSAATLTGAVDPNGQPTTYSFQYGTTTGYGSSTPSVSAGSGDAALAVSAPVTGLSAGQTYHFRLVATSPAGTTDGSDATFTLTAAPAVTTAAATSVGASGAKLNGTVDPNGQQTSWYFEYGPTTGYGSATAQANAGAGTQPVSVSVSLTGLSAKVYHYRLVATNAAGTSEGADAQFGSAPAPVVATGTAESATPSSVTLTGSVNPNGAATSWYFQYGTTTAYGSSSSSSSAGAGTSAKTVSTPISKLSPGTTYHYRLVASSSGGTSYGGDVTFSTPPTITLTAETSQAIFGRADTLSGTVAGAAAGAQVTVLDEPLGQASFEALTTVPTASNGSWSYQAKPLIATSYEATTSAGASTPVTIGLRPAVTIHLITAARFLVQVVAPSSFAGRVIQVQRLRPLGGWATLTRVHLNARSAATVPASLLPLGSSTIRIAMSINQAGRGYLAGFSRTLTYLRG